LIQRTPVVPASRSASVGVRSRGVPQARGVHGHAHGLS
jgi:hypothetical protein